MGCLTSADKRAASIGYSPYKCGYTSSSREVKKLSPGGFIKEFEDVEYEMPRKMIRTLGRGRKWETSVHKTINIEIQGWAWISFISR